MATVLSIAGFVVLFLVGLWLYSKYVHKWRLLDGERERRPTLREELPPPGWTQPRQEPENLTLAERNDRDRKIAAAVVKRWKRKGLV